MRKLFPLLLVVWPGWPAIVSAEPAALQVQVCVRGQGMPDSDIRTFRARIRQEFADLEVEASAPAGGVPAGGCTTQKHLRQARHARICGVIDMQVLRFGPVVHIDVRVLHAVLGKEILHLKARAAAGRFPGGTSLDPVLKKVVARLRKVSQRESDNQVSDSPDDEIPALPPEFMVLDEGLPEAGAGFGSSSSDSTWSWVGGGLLVAGGVLCVVGAVYLAVPFQDALDTRADAYRSCHLPDAIPDMRVLYLAQLEQENDAANRALAIGWAGTATGIALLAGGTAALVLDAKCDDSTTIWAGTGLAAGGAVLAGVGIYLLAGPARDALDRRDAAAQKLLGGQAADKDIEDLASEVANQDRRAFEQDAFGWVLTTSGAVLLAGGAVLLWTGAAGGSDTAGPAAPAQVRPMLLPGGGGLFFQLRW